MVSVETLGLMVGGGGIEGPGQERQLPFCDKEESGVLAKAPEPALCTQVIPTCDCDLEPRKQNFVLTQIIVMMISSIQDND